MDMLRHSSIISDPSKGRMSERKVMDGVIHSGVLNTFQTGAVDGLVQSGMPEHKRRKHDSGKAPLTHKSKKPATPYSPGFVHYPGSQF